MQQQTGRVTGDECRVTRNGSSPCHGLRVTYHAAQALCLGLGVLLLAFDLPGADTLDWRAKQNRVTADLRDVQLLPVLSKIAAGTGWRIYVEPGTAHPVSAKFKNVPPGEALHSLLGDLNFALVPETNKPSSLYIFRTTRESATQLVVAANPTKGKVIPNELIVKLKPGGNIDDLARSLGAKVIGRIPGINAYRLQFDSEDAANSARSQLALNPNVASVDSNYSIDRPPGPRDGPAADLAPPKLQLKPPPASGRVVVGLIDTAVQPLGNNLDGFLLKPLSVAGQPEASPDSPTHGTSMAETVLRGLEAVTKGSTSVQILPVDVYGPNATTSTFDVANGIVAAVNGGANVLNLSLGSDGDSPFLRSLIQDAIGKKIAIFAAAGNEPVTTPYYPAAYSDIGVIAVTATDHGQLASYANRGSFVTVGAPGTSLVYFNGQQYYAVGTSSSTAVTSGMAAGYMDTTHNGVDKMQSFIRSTLALKPGAGP